MNELFSVTGRGVLLYFSQAISILNNKVWSKIEHDASDLLSLHVVLK